MMLKMVALLVALGFATPALAQRPVVVELFTSQGCSSCPPADALLSELARRPDVLALAFHVTYWNGLGWRDPFSLDAATARQRGYQRLLGSETIYTPQMIIDGHADVVGSDREGVAAALAKARTGASVPIAITQTTGGLAFQIGAGSGAAQLLLVGFDGRHLTAVARGENAGRRLVETNIVRSVTPLANWQGAALALSAALPAGDHAAVILQDSAGRILGASVISVSSSLSRADAPAL